VSPRDEDLAVDDYISVTGSVCDAISYPWLSSRSESASELWGIFHSKLQIQHKKTIYVYSLHESRLNTLMSHITN